MLDPMAWMPGGSMDGTTGASTNVPSPSFQSRPLGAVGQNPNAISNDSSLAGALDWSSVSGMGAASNTGFPLSSTGMGLDSAALMGLARQGMNPFFQYHNQNSLFAQQNQPPSNSPRFINPPLHQHNSSNPLLNAALSANSPRPPPPNNAGSSVSPQLTGSSMNRASPTKSTNPSGVNFTATNPSPSKPMKRKKPPTSQNSSGSSFAPNTPAEKRPKLQTLAPLHPAMINSNATLQQQHLMQKFHMNQGASNTLNSMPQPGIPASSQQPIAEGTPKVPGMSGSPQGHTQTSPSTGHPPSNSSTTPQVATMANAQALKKELDLLTKQVLALTEINQGPNATPQLKLDLDMAKQRHAVINQRLHQIVRILQSQKQELLTQTHLAQQQQSFYGGQHQQSQKQPQSSQDLNNMSKQPSNSQSNSDHQQQYFQKQLHSSVPATMLPSSGATRHLSLSNQANGTAADNAGQAASGSIAHASPSVDPGQMSIPATSAPARPALPASMPKSSDSSVFEALSREEWEARFEQFGGKRDMMTTVGGTNLDLYTLFHIVVDYGGYNAACAEKKWSEIAKVLQIAKPSSVATR
ncbi:hypothetical protein BC829DRAFT_185829 [Chytridium lagenaria]|nr:hypothetical protein BC829DRAFT_185829 [Chytridium lagenaria]